MSRQLAFSRAKSMSICQTLLAANTLAGRGCCFQDRRTVCVCRAHARIRCRLSGGLLLLLLLRSTGRDDPIGCRGMDRPSFVADDPVL